MQLPCESAVSQFNQPTYFAVKVLQWMHLVSSDHFEYDKNSYNVSTKANTAAHLSHRDSVEYNLEQPGNCKWNLTDRPWFSCLSASNRLCMNDYNDAVPFNQVWCVGEERIQHRHFRDRVFDVCGSNEDNGAEVCTWEWHEGDNQKWSFDYQWVIFTHAIISFLG